MGESMRIRKEEEGVVAQPEAGSESLSIPLAITARGDTLIQAIQEAQRAIEQAISIGRVRNGCEESITYLTGCSLFLGDFMCYEQHLQRWV
jgi:hypothetical protein